MTKLIVWVVVSLDGYFEGEQPGDLRHHNYIWGEDLRQLSLQIGAEAELIVFGRRTYEGMAAHWPRDTTEPEIAEYMNRIPKLVASSTLTSPSWTNTTATAAIAQELRKRKREAHGPIYIFGSALLADGLFQEGLIDELLIGIAPVILGRGTPFFKTTTQPRQLQLLESRTTDTGGVILRYEVS